MEGASVVENLIECSNKHHRSEIGRLPLGTNCVAKALWPGCPGHRFLAPTSTEGPDSPPVNRTVKLNEPTRTSLAPIASPDLYTRGTAIRGPPWLGLVKAVFHTYLGGMETSLQQRVVIQSDYIETIHIRISASLKQRLIRMSQTGRGDGLMP